MTAINVLQRQEKRILSVILPVFYLILVIPALLASLGEVIVSAVMSDYLLSVSPVKDHKRQAETKFLDSLQNGSMSEEGSQCHLHEYKSNKIIRNELILISCYRHSIK